MNICILGNGGHARVVADAIRQSGNTVARFLDETTGDVIEGHPNQEAFIAIGHNAARERLSAHDFYWVNVVHPKAQVSYLDSAGSYFGANCIIGEESRVGDFSIINTGVILEHDSIVGDFTHLCPGVVTGGRVKIGSRTTIGLGAMIRDGITIGNNCVIGFGSVVTKDIPDNTTAYGNPARIIK